MQAVCTILPAPLSCGATTQGGGGIAHSAEQTGKDCNNRQDMFVRYDGLLWYIVGRPTGFQVEGQIARYRVGSGSFSG
jgi:hypothetical protein